MVWLNRVKWTFWQDHLFGTVRWENRFDEIAQSPLRMRGLYEVIMSSPQIRRVDRAMSDERSLETLARGYSGRLATVSEDGFPYCIPLLYLWLDGEVYLHTTSAGGHLRANIERDRRVCFEIDEQEGVFDCGRFECDSGLAYRSVCLFGLIRIVGDREAKQRFCE